MISAVKVGPCTLTLKRIEDTSIFGRQELPSALPRCRPGQQRRRLFTLPLPLLRELVEPHLRESDQMAFWRNETGPVRRVIRYRERSQHPRIGVPPSPMDMMETPSFRSTQRTILQFFLIRDKTTPFTIETGDHRPTSMGQVSYHSMFPIDANRSSSQLAYHSGWKVLIWRKTSPKIQYLSS